jgi:phosphatidate cytidylyltransferase
MQRLLTAAIGTPLILAAVFLLPSLWFFVLIGVLVELAVFEYIAIVRPHAPHAPLWLLLALVPLAALAFTLALADELAVPRPGAPLFVAGTLLSVGLGTLLLLSRTPLPETLPALGIFGFGIPYFAIPWTSLHALQQAQDPGGTPDYGPWLIILLLAVVWLGDTAAYYVGSRIGRHKMAPVISPNKSWEGAAAGFLTGIAAAAVWCLLRLGRIDGRILAVAAVTAVAAQIGDLVESMIKRGAGVKDSGHILPGHGGVFDRMDALLFAAPVLLAGLWLLGLEDIAR